jgi:hypothetical protein
MIYSFLNTKTGEVRDIVMKMKDYQHYKGENGDEDCWERIYDLPQISMGHTSTKSVDPWDQNSFVNRTADMKGTYGDMENHARELSEKRAAQSATGEDPLKRKYFDNYEKKTGKKHLADKPKTIETKNVKIDF